MSDRPLRGALRTAWSWTLAADRLVRLHLAFFTALWPLLGAASVSRDPSAGELAALLAIMLCFHVYAYVLNDVIDLPIDRANPARQHDPLVRGALRPGHALMLAFAQPALALLLAISFGSDADALVTLTAGFAFMGAYNLWGKRCPFPPLTDAIQGMAWGSLAIFAPQALGIPPNALTWAVAAYAVVFTMFINGVHGSLRDLSSDLASGVRTTAIFLGARTGYGQAGGFVPAALAVYAWCILAVLIAINIAVMLRNDFGYGLVEWSVTAAIVTALNCSALFLQPGVVGTGRSGGDVAWRLQMYVMLISLPVAFIAHTSVTIVMVLAALNAFAFALFDCTAEVTRWVWLAMRSPVFSLDGRRLVRVASALRMPVARVLRRP